MNTEETSLTDLQPNTNTEDGMVVCGQSRIEKISSDVNENKLNIDKDQSVTGKEEITVQTRDAQDSFNNNENCNLMCGQLSCRKSSDDSNQVTRDLTSSKVKGVTGRRNNRNKKHNNGKATVDDLPVSEDSTCAVVPESPLDIQPRTQNHLRDSLFSLIREGFEQTDARMLPTCLHQIAETYFLEENYEKAMQFIQLERIYHEKLLVNLSAIQEQWETKWKTSKSTSLPLLQNSKEKGLSSQELEKLSGICVSHQDPHISKCLISISKKVRSCTDLMESEETRDVDGPIGICPDRESEPGSKTTEDWKRGVAAMTENSPPSVSKTDVLSGAADQAIPGERETEEQHISSSGTTLETHTHSTWTGGRANADSSFSFGDSGKNNLLQPEATLHSNEVSEIEALSKEREEARNPMVDKLISTATVNEDCISGTQDDVTQQRSLLQCSSPIPSIHTDKTPLGDGDAVEKGFHNVECQVGETRQPAEVNSNLICSAETLRAQQQATVEFIASLLNGDLKDGENFLAHLDFQEEIFPEEEMSPSPGETVLGDNLLSLDELARRIQIEELIPAPGLVSILKKRNGNEGEYLMQSSQKQTKRKVRFQETDDGLDQEEIGGGSCILLIALCIATVFLSIGGTALYCTFGDTDSSVCKEFAANVDFYYTQAVRGMEELRHWLVVT